MHTQGVVIHGQEDFRYQDLELPEPGEEEVLVEIESCGICAADPKIYYGTAYFAKAAYSYAPIVAGHEFMGRVLQLGPGAGEKFGLAIGDRAIPENIVPCGQCYYCRRGQYNLCEPHAIFGIVKYNGGWARHMIYPKGAIIHKVPETVGWQDAATIEPLACAIHGVNRAKIQFGETVVVIGGGPIGLFMVQAAKLKNPRMVIAVDRHDTRLKVAKELGADVVINPTKADAVAQVKALTEDGVGCDIVLEAAGSNASVLMAVELLRRGGRLMECAVFAENVSFDWSVISDIKELEIIGAHLAFHTYPIAIDLLSRGLITSRGIVTHTFPLRDFKRAIDTAKGRREGAIKVLMKP
jgi:2-desacetyl-2-hydroxyethyl bacteriochlorophyllide A dehydrogenase